jgi:multidrug efflux pump
MPARWRRWCRMQIAPTVFWGPMAYAVIGGLVVATLLTLVFLPALYVAGFRVQPAATSLKCDRADDLVDQQGGAATLEAAA